MVFKRFIEYVQGPLSPQTTIHSTTSIIDPSGTTISETYLINQDLNAQSVSSQPVSKKLYQILFSLDLLFLF